MKRPSYPSDLTEDEWLLVEPLLPPAQRIGHPREVNLKEILNAIFYWADNGIKWRAMPHDFPPWQTVYGYFRSWVRTGIWSAINHSLVQRERRGQGRSAEPSLIMIDSQSVKIAHKGGPERGFDGGKQVKGRKRHIVVDCIGLVHNCFVHAANRADVKTAPTVLVPVLEESPRIEKILADQSYRGSLAQSLEAAYNCVLEITGRLAKSFVVEPWRWVVERTFALA